MIANQNKPNAAAEMKEILRSRQLNETLHQMQLSRDGVIVVRSQASIKRGKR